MFAELTSRCVGFRNSDILRQHSANPLAIPPIRLNGQRLAPSSTNEYPKLVKRAGNFLVSLLRTEYEERKVPICNLRADEALDLLKEQFGQYYRGEAPFNRPVIGDEGPREWWEALNCDRSHRTQPIAVSASLYYYPKTMRTNTLSPTATHDRDLRCHSEFHE